MEVEKFLAMDETKTKPWYERKEFYGALVTSVTPMLLLFPEHTIAFKVGIAINALAGGLLSYLGITKGYKAKNMIGQENSNLQLPSGIRRK